MKHQFESFAFDKLGVPPSTVIAGGVIIAVCLAGAFAAYGIVGVICVLLVVAPAVAYLA